MLSFSTAMSLFPGLVVGLLAWVAWLVGKHGWAWVWSYIKARAERAKTQLGQVEERFVALENDVKALKSKVGL
jgi:hypothetical protein